MTLEQAKADWNNFKATREELGEIQDGLAFNILRMAKGYFHPLKQPEEYMEMYEFIESKLKLSTQSSQEYE